jgi:hypothetical protein
MAVFRNGFAGQNDGRVVLGKSEILFGARRAIVSTLTAAITIAIATAFTITAAAAEIVAAGSR